jgi:hypothetical protein
MLAAVRALAMLWSSEHWSLSSFCDAEQFAFTLNAHRSSPPSIGWLPSQGLSHALTFCAYIRTAATFFPLIRFSATTVSTPQQPLYHCTSIGQPYHRLSAQTNHCTASNPISPTSLYYLIGFLSIHSDRPFLLLLTYEPLDRPRSAVIHHVNSE